ncbi:uncharacterized protein [Antedon mediterranea]|uniref:uncharacterized protein isoform X2 n=1 Tax=Antedon mediterranea TaxID=105859 RepID=UPI003AF67329
MRALSVGLTNLSALQVKTSKLDKRLAPLEAIGVIDSIIRPNSNTKLVSSGSSMSTTEECEDTLEMSSPDTSKVGKKSKKEKRSEAYNCGLCNEICENEAILCDTCHNFYHSKCENITPSLKLQLSYLMQEFVCSNCCQKDNYDFEAAISRLSQSAVIGQLDSGVQMEKILLRDKPEFNVQHTLQKGKYVIDRVARSILKKYAKHITSFPVAIERDGNCLFSALSVAVHGNATKAAELRTRTAIEMVSHRKFYQSVHVRSGILLVSPDLEEACLDCAQNGCYSSAWTIHAASSVLGRPIRSIYPPVNGLHDRCYEIMDRTFSPRILIDSSDVTIMWSGENPSGRKAWIPNHFVPLLRLEKDDPIVENTDLQYTAVYTMVNNEVVVSTDNSGISLELDPAILYEELPVVGTPIDCPSDNPLKSPERFLTPNEIFKIMLSEKPTSTSIPNGIKHNVYFLLDNSVNISRWANGQRSQYKDDCNWSTKTSSNRHYYVLVDDHLSYVDKKDGLFCKDVNHKRIPIEPQPEEDSIILFRRYYATHKDLLSFKKKISVVLECPGRLDHLKSLSVIEYVGPWPTNYQTNYPTMTSSPKKRKIIKKPNETFDEQANAVQMIQ